jgi:N-terminal domain of cytochrome oxidase-cbb3, FixP
MALVERDPHTGYMTTGHEWNGIKELNTPVPRVVYFFLIVTALFSVIYWVLMPAWPLGLTYTRESTSAPLSRNRSNERHPNAKPGHVGSERRAIRLFKTIQN